MNNIQILKFHKFNDNDKRMKKLELKIIPLIIKSL